VEGWGLMAKWYTAIGVGTNGAEMLHSGTDMHEASSVLRRIEVRAMANGHREIEVYSWSGDEEVTYENLDIEEVKKYAKRVY